MAAQRTRPGAAQDAAAPQPYPDSDAAATRAAAVQQFRPPGGASCAGGRARARQRGVPCGGRICDCAAAGYAEGPSAVGAGYRCVQQAHACAVKHHQVSTQPRSSTCRLFRLVTRLKSQAVTCMFGVAWVAASFQTWVRSAHSGRRWLAGSSGRRIWVLASARAIPVQCMPMSREFGMRRACLQVLDLFCKGG